MVASQTGAAAPDPAASAVDAAGADAAADLVADARILPALTGDSGWFWTAGAHGRLLIARCQDCARHIHPPMPVCAACLSRAVRPEPVSGRATVVSFTVNHEAWLPGLAVPYVVAYVELVEQAGLWLMTNIVDCPVEAVHIGMPVRVRFLRRDDVWLPLFVPDAA